MELRFRCMEKGHSWLSEKLERRSLGGGAGGGAGRSHFGQQHRINEGLQWGLRLAGRSGSDSSRP